MTFLERIQKTEAAGAVNGSDGLTCGFASGGSICGEPVADTEGPFSHRFTVEALRRHVQQLLPFETVAAIMAENPERARNELRSACRQVLAGTSWNDCPVERKQRLTDELLSMVFGLGPIEEMVYDESITEIMVNGSHSIYFERDGKLVLSEVRFENDEQVRVLIDRIIEPLGRRLDESSPMVNARLPQGHRVNAIIPPLAPDGPVLTIRAFARKVMTLEEMERRGSFDATVRRFLEWLVLGRKNIAVSGGTGSGKTTLLNALSCCIPPDERIITIEDALELKFDEHPHVVRLEARPRNAEGLGEVTIRDLVVNALRMRPDRIIVGECRAGEAIDMLQAMATGHEGSLTTLHANSPADVVERMVTMVRFAMDLPVDAIEMQIGSAFDYVVQVARAADGSRYLAAIAECSFDSETRRCRMEAVYERGSHEPRGTWTTRPSCLADLLAAHLVGESEVRSWWRQACSQRSE